MSLFNDIKDKTEQISDVLSDIQKEVDAIDDEVRDIIESINNHRCETVDEYDDFLSEIESKLESVRGRLY